MEDPSETHRVLQLQLRAGELEELERELQAYVAKHAEEWVRHFVVGLGVSGQTDNVFLEVVGNNLDAFAESGMEWEPIMQRIDRIKHEMFAERLKRER